MIGSACGPWSCAPQQCAGRADRARRLPRADVRQSARLGSRRAAQDERGEGCGFPLLRRAIGAVAQDQPDERLVDIGCQEADELLPGRRVLMSQQHVRDFVQGDVGSVERGGPGLVVDVVGILGADPQPARTLRPGAERAQQDRPPPRRSSPATNWRSSDGTGICGPRRMTAYHPSRPCGALRTSADSEDLSGSGAITEAVTLSAGTAARSRATPRRTGTIALAYRDEPSSAQRQNARPVPAGMARPSFDSGPPPGPSGRPRTPPRPPAGTRRRTTRRPGSSVKLTSGIRPSFRRTTGRVVAPARVPLASAALIAAREPIQSTRRISGMGMSQRRRPRRSSGSACRPVSTGTAEQTAGARCSRRALVTRRG